MTSQHKHCLYKLCNYNCYILYVLRLFCIINKNILLVKIQMSELSFYYKMNKDYSNKKINQ